MRCCSAGKSWSHIAYSRFMATVTWASSREGWSRGGVLGYTGDHLRCPQHTVHLLQHRSFQLRCRQARQPRCAGMLLVLAHRQVVAVEAPVLLAGVPGVSTRPLLP